MRSAPKDVRPVVHGGVRYEAPHWGHMFDPPEPEPSDEETALLERVEAAIANHMTEIVPPFDLDGDSLYDRAALERVLRANGSFTPDDIAAAVRNFEATFGGPPSAPTQNGGYVVARDPDSDEELWRLQVYRTDYEEALERCVQDIFVTSLAIDGEHLIVRDELRRVHRVDLRQQRVVESHVAQTPTSEDVSRIALRTVPRPTLDRLIEHIMALKLALDQYELAQGMRRMSTGPNAAVFQAMQPMLDNLMSLPEPADEAEEQLRLDQMMKQMQTLAQAEKVRRANPAPEPPPPEPPPIARPETLDGDLAAVLADLAPIAHVDGAIDSAYEAGIRCKRALIGGAEPEVVNDWFRGELFWIFEELLRLSHADM